MGETHCPECFCGNGFVITQAVTREAPTTERCNMSLNAHTDWPTPAPLTHSLTTTAPLQVDHQELEEIHQQIQREYSKTERYRMQIQETDQNPQKKRHSGGSNNKVLPRRNSGKVQVRTLTHDTANAITWSFHALNDLAKDLLGTNTELQYVCQSFLRQDNLESHLAHFRPSAGCNYSVTTKDIFCKHYD